MKSSACTKKRTQGETQTPKGVWVSPAPERERERKRENVVGEQTKQPEKERGQTNILADRGQVLKGTKPNKIPTPETKRTTQNTQTSSPEKPNKNQTQNQQSLGGLVTAGWRGPWAALHSWGVTPGDRSTEGYKYPPTTGTAPGGARAVNLSDTKQRPQKLCPGA